MQKNQGNTSFAGTVLLYALSFWSSLAAMSVPTASAWPAGTSSTVPVCTAAGNQFGVKLIRATDGYIVVWQDPRRADRDICAQKFGNDGIMNGLRMEG